jgi:hypothetical protein
MVQRGYLWRSRWRWASSDGCGRVGDSQRGADAVGSLTVYAFKHRNYSRANVIESREHSIVSLSPLHHLRLSGRISMS